MRIIIFLILGSIMSCTNIPSHDVSYNVKYKGALKKMMHEGDISAQADLTDFKDAEYLYALGAIENLKGEIQIFDGKAYNTIVIDSTLTFDNSFNKKATLFVYATVSSWSSISIPEDIVTYEQLELFVEQTAKENNIDINEPFPFLLEGNFKSFDWHVINWKDGDTDHSHENHMHSGLYGTENDQQGEMLGFYSDSHHAIFTHHTTNMHIHIITSDKELAGHVDGLTLGKGIVLKLPEIK